MLRAVRLTLQILVAAAVLCAALLAIYVLMTRASLAPVTAASFSRTDFITILLGAVTIVLGSLAIILAVAAAVGYATIKDAARAGAERQASEVARIVATQVAQEVASTVASRVAEATAAIASGASEAGDQIAEAERKEDAGGS